jgi:hypothetical protein
MGLYLAFASFWLLGIINSKYWQAAIVSNIFFMFGLAFGRIISVISDGSPSTIFVLGTFGELALGFYAMYVLKKSNKYLNQIISKIKDSLDNSNKSGVKYFTVMSLDE